MTSDQVQRQAAPEERVFAVFSSETGPYREALAGLEQELRTGIQPIFLSRGEPNIPRSAHVILAFGSKAALREYPDETVLIVAMAPGAEVPAQNAVRISMEPEAVALLSNLSKIQPGIRRLGLLWSTAKFRSRHSGYVAELQKAAAAQSLTLVEVEARDSSDVPDQLRWLYSKSKVDALWVPPDPLLLNAASLPVLIEFSRANRVPLYVPTGGLVEQGATAAVSPTFREMGRLAGVAARKALQNLPQENEVHAVNIEVVINKTVAAQVGLQIPEETLRKADRVVP